MEGDGFLKQALTIFIVIAVGLIIWGLGRWLFPKLNAPAMVLTVWDGLFVLVGAVAVINFLLSLIGKGFIKW